MPDSPTSPSSCTNKRRSLSVPAIRLQERPNFGYLVQFDILSSENLRSCLLVSIDGKSLRHLNLDQIKEHLLGETGTTVEIEVFCTDFNLRTIRLNRDQMILAPEVLTPEKLHTHLKSLETFGVPPWNSIGQDHNIDLLIRSNSKKVLKACNKLPEPKKGVMELAALAAIATNQMIGASEDQQNFLETCLKGCTNLFIRIAGDILQSVILNLTAQGSHNDADLLVSAVLGNGTAHLRNFPELLMAILTISGPERSPKLIEILERELRPDASFWGDQPYVMGTALEAADKNSRALEVFEKHAPYVKVLKKKSPNFLQGHRTALILFSAGRLQSELGNLTEAQGHFENLQLLYEWLLTSEQMKTVDRIPLFFPTPSEVAAAIEDLKSGKAISRNEFDTTLTVPLKLNFSLVKEFHEACLRDDQITAAKALDRLIATYKNLPVKFTKIDQNGTVRDQESPWPRRQNLYCTIVTLSRRLADKGWLELSETAIKNLIEASSEKYSLPEAAILHKAFLHADLVCNAVLANGASEEKWLALIGSLHFTTRHNSPDELQKTLIWKDYPESYRLRLLAQAYFCAGETERAKIIIEKALDLAKSESDRPCEVSLPSSFNEEIEEAILNLNAATIFADSGKFEEASRQLALKSTAPILSESYCIALLQLVNVYENNGKYIEAQHYLERVLAAAPESVTSVSDATKSYAQNQQDFLYSQLYLHYAENLLSQEKYVAASIAATKSVTLSGKRVPYNAYVLAAKCAEGSNDFATAASNYLSASELRRVGASLPTMQGETETKFAFLSEAMSNAEKATEIDPLIMSNICFELAKATTCEPEKQLSLYQRAFDLTPIASEKKAPRAQMLAKLQSKPVESAPLSALHIAIDSALEAAQYADANNFAEAHTYWLSLAILEARNNQLESAIQHARNGLLCFTSNSMRRPSYYQLHELDRLLPWLLTAGAVEEAKTLMQESVNRVKSVMGEKSKAAHMQLEKQFEFYAKTTDFVQAERTLDELMTCYDQPSQTEHLASEAMIQLKSFFMHRPWTEGFTSESLLKILNREKSIFNASSDTIRHTLTMLAQSYISGENFAEAERCYIEYLERSKGEKPDGRALARIRTEYKLVLHRLGKLKEAEELDE